MRGKVSLFGDRSVSLLLHFVAASLSFFAMTGVAGNPILEQEFWNWAFATFLTGSGLACCWVIY